MSTTTDPLRDIEARALAAGVRLTAARRLVAKMLMESTDHPDVTTLHARIRAVDPHFGIATLHRTLAFFEELGLVDRHAFTGGDRYRYEVHASGHHDDIVDVKTDTIVEFRSAELERLHDEVARKLGYRIVEHRCELYAEKLER